jgi:hypothetical protein
MCIRGGGSPGDPLMYLIPPIASATDAKPARGAYGPLVLLVEAVRPEVPLLERPGAEVLDEHVGVP